MGAAGGGELDLVSAAGLAGQARDLVGDRADRLVLNLSGLRFTDCAGVRELAAMAALGPGGGPVAVRSEPEAVRRVRELMGVEFGRAEAAPAWSGPGHRVYCRLRRVAARFAGGV